MKKRIIGLRVYILRTTDLAKILRASRFTLNRLILRCQLGSSVSGGGVSGREYLFTIEDTAKVSLAYWLSRAGLHTGAVREFLAVPELDEFSRKLTSSDSIEAEGNRTEYLICWGEPTGRKKTGRKKGGRGYELSRRVALCRDIEAVERTLGEVKQPAFVLLPVGRLLTELAENVRSFLIRQK